VSNLPAWAQPLALAFPLHHLVELTRRFGLGAHETSTVFSTLYLVGFAAAFTLAALSAMRRRLIQ
jgi:ABC-type polysaccharide/polyol phosphate export permease